MQHLGKLLLPSQHQTSGDVLIQTIVTNAHCLDEVTLMKGSLVAIRPNIIPRNTQKQMTEKPTKLHGSKGNPENASPLEETCYQMRSGALYLKQ